MAGAGWRGANSPHHGLQQQLHNTLQVTRKRAKLRHGMHAAKFRKLTHGGDQASKAIWALQLKLWCRHQWPGRVDVC